MAVVSSKPADVSAARARGINPLAGQPAPAEVLIDPQKLREEYYRRRPDAGNPAERVSFGTSGHRGSALRGSFNEFHVLAITQAICEYRKREGTTGPPCGGLYLKPPSSGGLCEGVMTIPSAFCAGRVRL